MGIKPVQERPDPFRDAQPVGQTVCSALHMGGHTMINTPHHSIEPPPLSIGGQIGHFIKWKHAKRRTVLLHEAGYLLLGLVLLATLTGDIDRSVFLAGRATGRSGVHLFGRTCPGVPCK